MNSSSATRALALEYKSVIEDPVEGFRVKLMKDDDLFNWEVAIFGPPDTPYQGGYFKAHMRFPKDYPYAPPTIRFVTKVWHPNVYENGDLCISILHPPVSDPQSGEDPSERWNPTQNVRTILLSVISLLNEPNTFSPANVDASVMYRRWKESKGVDKEYENIIRHQVNATKSEAEKDNVVVPLTQEEWCMKIKPKIRHHGEFSSSHFSHTSIISVSADGNPNSSPLPPPPLYMSSLDHADFYIDDDGFDDDEEDEEDDGTAMTSSASSSEDERRRRRPVIIATSNLESVITTQIDSANNNGGENRSII